MESYEQIVKGLTKEAMDLRRQIEETHNPLKKQVGVLNQFA